MSLILTLVCSTLNQKIVLCYSFWKFGVKLFIFAFVCFLYLKVCIIFFIYIFLFAD